MLRLQNLQLLVSLAAMPAFCAEHPCAGCHPKQVAGYLRSPMARSVSRPVSQPGGSFEHAFSATRFSIRSGAGGLTQRYERNTESGEWRVAWVIGSGAHAYGYLVQAGNALFQSPLSYYTQRQKWDMAPGYETDPHPDFSRPVTLECLLCHSGKPQPIAGTLNRYRAQPFAEEGISCERCHGPSDQHLRKPVAGSIVNPAKLEGPVRDSVCEQCHLIGQVRIPNPGTTPADFRPGERLEDVFTIYVSGRDAARGLKVVSHAEQLALSPCARSSGGKLWCGTCHNPHEEPAKKAEYYRERCLKCHAGTMAKTIPESHFGPLQDCISCHMPKQAVRDGGHTAFTNHRIARDFGRETGASPSGDLSAWREPPFPLRARNLALALVTNGMQEGSANEVIRGYRMLNRIEKDFENDPAVLTALGTVVLRAKESDLAAQYFEKALRIQPDSAPYEVNLGAALLQAGRSSEATRHLENAVTIDPLLRQAVDLLTRVYTEHGQQEKARDLTMRYRLQMGMK
jgi:hypothetical protein